jgi:hypothetical protein
MRKKPIILLMMIFVLVLCFSAEMNLRNIDSIISDICQEQNVEKIDQVNPDKISQQLLADQLKKKY